MSLSVQEDSRGRSRTSSVGRFFESFKKNNDYGKLTRTASSEELVQIRGEGAVFHVTYYGSSQVESGHGKVVTAKALQAVSDNPTKRKMTMKVSVNGITLTDDETKIVVEDHKLHHISQCAHDVSPENCKYISYIAYNKERKQYACHVFKYDTSADVIHAAISRAFDEAFKVYQEKQAHAAALAAQEERHSDPSAAPITAAQAAHRTSTPPPPAAITVSPPSAAGSDGFDELATFRVRGNSDATRIRKPNSPSTPPPSSAPTGNLIDF